MAGVRFVEHGVRDTQAVQERAEFVLTDLGKAAIPALQGGGLPGELRPFHGGGSGRSGLVLYRMREDGLIIRRLRFGDGKDSLGLRPLHRAGRRGKRGELLRRGRR